MMKNFEDFQTVGKDNMDATVASMTAMNKGFQTMASFFADYTRKAFEDGAEVFEKTLAAKSVDKVADIQTKFAKDAYEGYVERMTKLGEVYAETAKDVYKPFEARANEFAGKVSKAAKPV